MMRLTKGFTLIELLLYLMIGVMIVSSALFFAGYIQALTQQQLKPLHNTLEWYGALDAIVHDINAVTDWSDAASKNIWYVDNQAIEWRVVDARLLRYKGIYNSSKNEWISKRSAVVATNIISCKFHYNHQRKRINQVSTSLTCQQKSGPRMLIRRVCI